MSLTNLLSSKFFPQSLDLFVLQLLEQRTDLQERSRVKKYKNNYFSMFSAIKLCSNSHMVTLNIRRSQALPCRCGARLAVCRWRFPPPAAWRWRRWAEPAAGHGWCDWRWACTAPARQTGDTPRSPTRPSRSRRAACSQTHANVTPSLHAIKPMNMFSGNDA